MVSERAFLLHVAIADRAFEHELGAGWYAMARGFAWYHLQRFAHQQGGEQAFVYAFGQGRYRCDGKCRRSAEKYAYV
jgi:hypothetical protein